MMAMMPWMPQKMSMPLPSTSPMASSMPFTPEMVAAVMLKMSEQPFPNARKVTPATLCRSMHSFDTVASAGMRKSTIAHSHRKRTARKRSNATLPIHGAHGKPQ